MLPNEGAGLVTDGMAATPRTRAKSESSNPQKRKPRKSLTCGALCVNRSDRMPAELFVQGIRSWEAGIKRLFDGETVIGGCRSRREQQGTSTLDATSC